MEPDAGSERHRALRGQQGLRDGRGRRPGLAIREPRDPRGRVRRDHGPVRLGQDDPARHPRLPRPSVIRLLQARGRGDGDARRDAPRTHPRRAHRLRVPGLQPAAADERLSQRRAAARVCGRSVERASQSRARRARRSRPLRSRSPPPDAALGRPAAAGRGRPGARHAAERAPAGRADRQPRLHQRGGGSQSARARQPRRRDARHGHAFERGRGAGIAHRAPRRWRHRLGRARSADELAVGAR